MVTVDRNSAEFCAIFYLGVYSFTRVSVLIFKNISEDFGGF